MTKFLFESLIRAFRIRGWDGVEVRWWRVGRGNEACAVLRQILDLIVSTPLQSPGSRNEVIFNLRFLHCALFQFSGQSVDQSNVADVVNQTPGNTWQRMMYCLLMKLL